MLPVRRPSIRTAIRIDGPRVAANAAYIAMAKTNPPSTNPQTALPDRNQARIPMRAAAGTPSRTEAVRAPELLGGGA
jgi:hypothetical protein